MRKDLDYDRLIYYSNKLKNYISKKITEIKDSISNLSSKVDSDKAELETKIANGDAAIASQITSSTDTLNTKITGVNTKVDTLQDQVNDIDLNPMNGDVININKVKQYVYNNIKAGDVIEIPNDTGATDFMIECYTDIDATPDIIYKTVTFNTSTAGTFTYDPRFVEVTATGVKPKDTIVLNYTQTTETIGGNTYTYFTSDIIPEELTCNVNSVISIMES